MSRHWFWKHRELSVEGRNRAAQVRSRMRLRELTIQELETRTLLSVSALKDVNNTLNVTLGASGDQTTITAEAGDIKVTGTGIAPSAFTGIAALVVQGSNQENESVALTSNGGAALSLHGAANTDALAVSGVTSVTFTSVAVDATVGNVTVNATDALSATNPTLSTTFTPVTLITVTGGSIQADNITLQATATVTDTTNGVLAGQLGNLGANAGIADLEPSATVDVDTGANISVNGVSGNVTIGATASATINSTPTASSSLSPVDASIAVSTVKSNAVAHVSGGSTVAAGSQGTLNIAATNTTSLITDADGSASGSSAAGAVVAVAVDNSTTTAYLDGGSHASGGAVSIQSTATNTANTTAKSTAKAPTKAPPTPRSRPTSRTTTPRRPTEPWGSPAPPRSPTSRPRPRRT